MESKELVRSIYTAVRAGEAEEVETLIAGEKSVLNMSTPFGSWLHSAARAGQIKVVEKLVELGINVNATGGAAGGNALNTASSEGYLDIVNYLLNHGAEFDVSEPERNPLFAAIHNGHIDVVRTLIDNDIDITVKYTGETMVNMDAIAFAEEWGRQDIKALLEAHL